MPTAGVEQYRETLSADNQATFDAEVAELSGNGVEGDQVEGFILLGPSLLLANLVIKTVTSTKATVRLPSGEVEFTVPQDTFAGTSRT